MRIPLTRGRDFTERDDEKSPAVIIVNQAFADKYFPREDPVGRHMKPEFGVNGDPKEREIVGVVANIKDRSLSADYQPEYYVPLAQGLLGAATICVRTVEEPATVMSSVRSAFRNWIRKFLRSMYALWTTM